VKIKRFLLFILLSFSLSAHAVEVSLHAQASKDKVQLGESLVYQLTLNLQGQTQFSPQLALPKEFPGFQIVQGPQQQQSMNWVNGTVSQSWTFSWEIAPIRAGTLKLAPVKVTLKNPSGDEVKESEALSIEVPRGKANPFLAGPTPAMATPQPPQPMDLRPLKADLGLPWLILGLLALAVAGSAALILWLIFRPGKPRPAVPAVRNPGQLALFDLENARSLMKDGDLSAYFLEIARILRSYYRSRLSFPRPETTLLEIRALALAKLKGRPAEDRQAVEESLDSLNWVLFARHEPSLQEAEDLAIQARQAVLAFENLSGSKNHQEVK
jgi:hypothetical protein